MVEYIHSIIVAGVFTHCSVVVLGCNYQSQNMETMSQGKLLWEVSRQ